MIVPGQRLSIVIATRPVDFRCGHDALAAIVQTRLGLDPHSGLVVVSRSKRPLRPGQEQRAAVRVVPHHALHDQREARVQGACVAPLGRRSPFTPCGNRPAASRDTRG